MKKEDRDILTDAGFLFSEKGGVTLRGPAHKLFMLWIEYISLLLKPYYISSIQTSPFIEKEILVDSGYINHFPQHLFSATASSGQGRFLSPASCLHIYPYFKKKEILKTESFLTIGNCCRFENGAHVFPFRSAHFHMLELVMIGEAEELQKRYTDICNLVAKTLDSLGINGMVVDATDAFFLGESEGARLIQKIKALKKEYVAEWGGKQVALASFNNHEDYFAKKFSFSMSNKKANSFCIAFGLERLVAWSLLSWGKNAKQWPISHE